MHRPFRLCLVVSCLGLSALGSPDAESVIAPPPKQGAALLKTDILGVFAHPDDETGVAATLASYALGQGQVVANVYCTRGEGGGNMVGTQWGPALGILREAELRDCLKRLGVRYCFFLDRLDWAYTESLAATLRKWNHEETLGRLVRLVRALRPEVIITMNPAPSPGQHGHHQAAGVLATEAFDAAADPKRFPEQLTKEGLTAWQVRKLYYGGSSGVTIATITTTNALADGTTPADAAAEALANHRSQAFGNFRNSPWLRRPQSFTLVKSVVPFVPRETDLQRGLPVSDSAAVPVRLPEPAAAPVALSFVPLPAVARYQQWVKAQHLDHVAAQFQADIPLIAGEANPVRLEVENREGRDLAGEVSIEVPAAWLVERTTQGFSTASGRATTLAFQVTPPTGSPDAELTAQATLGGNLLKAVCRAHPVPRMIVPRVGAAPLLDGSGNGWEQIPTAAIPPSNLVEGHVASAADSSATFQLAFDEQRLYVDVEVKDDVVVSNIAPNDIRGHWRSDSVEICIDPVGGAEDTMGCFKVGIFPFDTTGVVRGARDADANQGPIEDTAPGTRLVSRRTSDGYRIQASIPFSEIGVKPTAGRRLGFNLIVYDGDKRNAAIGENINKSRIAWSPRPGVQGRPEDWGRIELE
ncbi:MAG: PIG-L family deacetylase [Verrucomicrobia bacterium]|nr:PIG-L family deacetylase [Verrucomicrobiota bacterium]